MILFLVLSLQLLVHVSDFCFTADPKASISAEISVHLLWDFELFRSSFELYTTPSTGDDRLWLLGLEFQSLLDHPVCLFCHGTF